MTDAVIWELYDEQWHKMPESDGPKTGHSGLKQFYMERYGLDEKAALAKIKEVQAFVAKAGGANGQYPGMGNIRPARGQGGGRTQDQTPRDRRRRDQDSTKS
jgi:hypothetical protein